MKDLYWKENLLAKIKALNPGSSDFYLMVNDLIVAVQEHLEAYPVYKNEKIIERLIEPEQMHLFRVCWRDDEGQLQVNKGYYIKMNATLGTPQGAVRFHPSINLGLLKALALEKTLQNSLTGLHIGGACAAADFDAKNKSDGEIMRFCQSFMTELYPYIGPHKGLLHGEIGVGQKEIGYLFGQYKRLTHRHESGLLDKGLDWGGTLLRQESVGYSIAYFTQTLLAHRQQSIKGKRINISGAGKVAIHAAEKIISLGGIVQSLSDTSGCLYAAEGISAKTLQDIKIHKLIKKASLQSLPLQKNLQFFSQGKPWSLSCEIAMPCACEKEINIEDAEKLTDNGCKYLIEGAYTACDRESRDWLLKHELVFVPAKLTTLGYAIIYALESNQNAQKHSSTEQHIDAQLKSVTERIHEQCVNFCHEKDAEVNYLKVADTMSFVRIANAMIEQGDY